MQYPDAGFDRFSDFFVYYLSEHDDPRNRACHYVGTTGAVSMLTLAIVTANPWLLLAAPLCGYGPAWVGHFIIEKNRPATFKHPIWSVMGDFWMTALFLTGQLGPRLEQARAAA